MEILSAACVFGSGFVVLGANLYLMVLLLKEHRRLTAAHILHTTGYTGDAGEKLSPHSKDDKDNEIDLRDIDFLGNHAP